MKINQILSENKEKTRLDPKCWAGKKIGNPKTKIKGGVRVNNCVPKEGLNEFAPSHGDDGNEDKLRFLASRWFNSDDATIQRQIQKALIDLGFHIDYQGEEQEGVQLIPAGQYGIDWEDNDIIYYNPEDLSESVEEDFNHEYDDESGMAHTNLLTIARAAQGLLDTIDDNENLPEWVQEKIAKVEGMLVSAWDYLQSQEDQGIDPRVEESAAWQRKAGKNKTGGLNQKGVDSYRREHPGSKLQTAVTTKPSKLKPGSKAAKRRKSFCARMSGVKGPMKDEHGKPTRKALALKKWNC